LPTELNVLIPTGLSVVQILPGADHVVLVARPTATAGACPMCGALSDRVHSTYQRRLADLPWQGRIVEIRVRARRFRCPIADCPRAIFTERLPEVVRPKGFCQVSRQPTRCSGSSTSMRYQPLWF